MTEVEAMSSRTGPWIETFTGKHFYPLDPKPEDFDLVDIAHSLANTCRFRGHVRRFFSVAEHSVNVSKLAEGIDPGAAVQGLLHDAAEAYLSDLASPLKPYIFAERLGTKEAIKNTELRVLRSLATATDGAFQIGDGVLSDLFYGVVAKADHDTLHAEARVLMPYAWDGERPFVPQRHMDMVRCLTPDQAEVEFLARALALQVSVP